VSKQQYADKWSPDVLEQVAATCNIASNTSSEADWELFLNAIHDAATTLPGNQRAVLLLSQEHGLSFSDIGRVLNMPYSTVMHHLSKAVDIIVEHLKEKSLISMRVRDESKFAHSFYCEHVVTEEHNAATRFGFYYDHEPPWFYEGSNILEDDGSEEEKGEQTFRASVK